MNDASRYGQLWTRDEVVLAFYLYCQIPFRRTKASTPEVQKLATLLGRSPAAVARKLGNLGSFDPELQRRGVVGLTHTSSVDRLVWDQFNSDWEALVTEAQTLLDSLEFEIVSTEPKQLINVRTTEAIRLQRIRLGQDFFRESVLSGYESVCCVTGIDISECLIASHIIPWSVREDIRLNPANGLCLSATFDRLFDRGLMTISADRTVVLSSRVIDSETDTTREFFDRFANRPISRPERFVPLDEYLEWHRTNVFRD